MNFLENYLLYSRSNESPTEYHTWGALSALSHLIGPRVWTHMGGHLCFYPNLYVFLVGAPGMTKTTAMRQAAQMIRSFPDIIHAPASASKEAIVELMKGEDSLCRRQYVLEDKKIAYSQLAVFASELVSLLNASGNPMGMIEFLTDIWDKTGEDYREVFKKSKSLIARPYVSILACLTPSTLQALVNTKVVSVGMSRRCIFVYANAPGEPHPFIEEKPEHKDAWKRCLTHGESLMEISGPFSWTDEAKEFYSTWYYDFKKGVLKVESEVLRNFYMTKPEYVIKVSMLLALAEQPSSLTHTLNTFQRALDLVTSVESGACQLFDSAGRNELAPLAGRIEEMLKERTGKPVDVKELYIRFWKDVKNTQEIDAIIQHFERSYKVKRHVASVGGTVKVEITYQG